MILCVCNNIDDTVTKEELTVLIESGKIGQECGSCLEQILEIIG